MVCITNEICSESKEGKLIVLKGRRRVEKLSFVIFCNMNPQHWSRFVYILEI